MVIWHRCAKHDNRIADTKHVKDRLYKAIPFDLLVLRSISSRKTC